MEAEGAAPVEVQARIRTRSSAAAVRAAQLPPLPVPTASESGVPEGQRANFTLEVSRSEMICVPSVACDAALGSRNLETVSETVSQHSTGPAEVSAVSLSPPVLSSYSPHVTTGQPAASPQNSWVSDQNDVEVASYFRARTPSAFELPPSRPISRRTVSRQSHHSVPGDPLVDLMAKMVENTKADNERREAEIKAEMERREREGKQEAERRERENRQEIERRCRLEFEIKLLNEKLSAAEKENKLNSVVGNKLNVECGNKLNDVENDSSYIFVCNSADRGNSAATSLQPAPAQPAQLAGPPLLSVTTGCQLLGLPLGMPVSITAGDLGMLTQPACTSAPASVPAQGLSTLAAGTQLSHATTDQAYTPSLRTQPPPTKDDDLQLTSAAADQECLQSLHAQPAPLSAAYVYMSTQAHTPLVPAPAEGVYTRPLHVYPAFRPEPSVHTQPPSLPSTTDVESASALDADVYIPSAYAHPAAALPARAYAARSSVAVGPCPSVCTWDIDAADLSVLPPSTCHVRQNSQVSVNYLPLGSVKENYWPLGVDEFAGLGLSNGFQRRNNTAVSVPSLTLVNRRPALDTTRTTSVCGLTGPSRLPTPCSAGTMLPKQVLDSLNADHVLSGYNLSAARFPDASGLSSLVVDVPSDHLPGIVSLSSGSLGARMPGCHTTNSFLTMHANSLQHRQPAGDGYVCEGRRVGSTYTLPSSLSAPDRNYLSTIYETDIARQPTGLNTVDEYAVNTLLPGLPPPPMDPVVYRRAPAVPVVAPSAMPMLCQLYTSTTTPAVQPSTLDQRQSSTVAAAPSSTSAGQFVAAITVPSAASVLPSTMDKLMLTDTASAVPPSLSLGTDQPPAASVVPAVPSVPSTLSGTSTMSPAVPVVGTSSTVLPSSVAGTDVAAVSSLASAVGTATSSIAAATTTSTTSGSSSGATTATSSAPPVVVVRQLQAVRPYNGSTSWKLFRDHFNRVAKVNQWTTNEDLVQHLTLSLEGAAAEVLRGFDDTSSTALADLWSRLEHRFGEVDSCRDAMRKFESRRQSDTESLVEFEQALRILHQEAWPSAAAGQRDAALKRRFEDGVASAELSQYLRLHHRDLGFAQTVEKARVFHATMEGGKAKKAVRFVGDVQHVTASQQDLLPVINHLKGIQGQLDKMAKSQAQSSTPTSAPPPTSSTPSTSTPLVPPSSQQQPWRPRGPPSSRPLFAGTGPRTGVRPPMFGSPASTPSSGRFPGPSGFRPPGPRVITCYVCGQRGCHSNFHRRDGSAPRPASPTSPRPGFSGRGRTPGCWVCGRYGCHSMNHPDQRGTLPSRSSSVPPPPQSSGNGPRSPIPGNRAPSPQFCPQSR